MKPVSPRPGRSPVVPLWLILTSVVVAVAGACPDTGSWNDGSRLATVEAIADHHTLAITDSIFAEGTKDKLFIKGHFYSDKPPVISLLMAGMYTVCRWFGLPTAAERPDLFCRAMTVGTSGLAYVVAVWCIYSLGRLAGLSPRMRLICTASFGLSTVALPYTRHVNSHILLLGVVAALLPQLIQLRDDVAAGRSSCRRLVLLGTLAGLAYNCDLGAGAVLLPCLFLLIAYRCRRPAPTGLFVLAAAPWLAAHHILNYSIGGVLKPMNTVSEYFTWPGSPFDPSNLTGFWRHSPVNFAVYALELLFGEDGFIGHNLPLFLALPALVGLLRRRSSDRPEAAFAAAWCGGTWLLYAMFSNNYGGNCCSIRWFVPFLAPSYYLIALHLRRFPSAHRDFCVLSLWGSVLTAIMWWHGPWMIQTVPGFWYIQAATLISWGACRYWSRREETQPALTGEPVSPAVAAREEI
jgi:hypothetical protein